MSERLVLEQVGASRPAAELPRAGTLLVGSDAAHVGFVISGAGVADVHCAIGRAKGGGWAVKDLGSLAGTQVNGKPVAAARLAAGDELRLGDALLRVVDPTAPAPRKAPGPEETQTLDASELEADLAGAQAAGAATAPPPASPAQNGGAARAAPLPAIPGYRVERRLGRGGMGDVYLAVQESLQRQVALKVLSPRFADDANFVRRFQAEARAAAALNHPNVVTVYDVGEERGLHHLSMEYMDRGTLEERVQGAGRLPVPEVLAILQDAARGLEYAEQRGIVHRDLKPANLMQNHVGQTKIADLGLATHVEAEETQTADRKVFGTPHFMSPEQARGERVDHRSDLYSLGATGYRLLTGHTPFEGSDAREIVRALLRDEPRPMRDFAPDLPDDVVALVARLMHKDPAQRFPNARAVLAELERLRAQAGAAPTTAAPRKRTSMVPLLLVLAAAAGAWWWFQGRQQPPGPGPRGAGTPPVAGATGNGGTGNGGTGRAPGGQPVAPGPGPEGVPPPLVEGPKPPTPPVQPKEKDDKELQLFEANARVALLELMQRDMKPEERRDELRLLAQRFQGTSSATDALAKADQISAQLDSAAHADLERKAKVDEVITALRAAARLDADPPEPGKAFLAMRTVPGQAELAEDADFVTRRKELENLVVGKALFHARQGMGEANQLLEKGDFEAGKAKLEGLLDLFALPEFPMGESPAGVSDLYEVGRQCRERFHNLAQLKGQFDARRQREDERAIAAGLGGASGLERELATLDLAAARARAERLAGEVRGDAEQAWARALAADCAAAEGALATLVREFGSWRRKAFNDPRDRRGAMRNAVGADAQGLLYDGDGGAERVPWSAFGANVKDLARLFVERLARDWTPEEQAGIAALLRLTAAAEAVQDTSKMFDASKRANFTEGNARDVLELYAQAQPWAEKAGGDAAARLARESDAAAILCAALRDATEGRWASATANVERLLEEQRDALLVRLLSDGRLVAELSNG